jgi:MazG family protein
MAPFDRLLEIADQLLAPGGCSWDREQTLFTLQPYLLEETHELIEAIDLQDPEKISEELGDVLYALVFIGKLSEGQKKFTIGEAIQKNCEKLIRRHPHVFGDLKVSSNEEIVKNWEEIKKKEKGHGERKGLFDGIPPSLPALPRAQKMAGKMKKKKVEIQHKQCLSKLPQSEEELGEMLWELTICADKMGIDAESALRRKLQEIIGMK